MKGLPRNLLWLVLGALAAGCAERAPSPSPEPERVESAESSGPSCEAPEVRAVVERLGERLKQVSLLAPDSLAVRAIREAYGLLVTPDLLGAWIDEPAQAPGRTTSSPWPERIEVRSVEPAKGGACLVEGAVVYVTSVEAAEGGAASRVPVALRVVEADGWRIAAYETGATPEPPEADPAGTDAQDAAEVVRRYYAAIDAGDYRRAYALWGNDGAASGQSFEAFAAGFSETARVEAEVGTPGRVEPAAGSRYVEVPVTIRAVTDGGERQRFEGTYTLRRSVVDGATDAQRQWRLYAADVERAPG